ncbi:hypothetical protein Tco_1180706, partial [Tanacetum coccineum]
MALCFCGQQTLIRTLWTDNHPGHRFHTCPRLGGTSCEFFDLYDPPICACAKNIIPWLLSLWSTCNNILSLGLPGGLGALAEVLAALLAALWGCLCGFLPLAEALTDLWDGFIGWGQLQ